MESVSITCCRCGGRFSERSLRGEWLNRQCPLCGKRLSEHVYDGEARHVLDTSRPHLGKRGKKKLRELAEARYYTSEWFRLACAGQGSETPGKGLFGLKPGYREDGLFDLVSSDDGQSLKGGEGISAEYFVFDALRAEIDRKRSPLHGARIVPHLKFPWLPGQKPKQWGAKQRAEVDCVVLCRSCAIVVEVKRRGHHVRVAADFKHIRERTAEGSFRGASETIEQVTRGADSFEERQGLYPHERIFRMIVYVEPMTFECKADVFKDGMLVSCLDADRNARFVPAMRDLVGRLEPIADPKEVRELASRMLSEFGNTSGRRVGGIVCGQGPEFERRLHRTDRMLAAIGKRMRSGRSPLHGSHLLTNLTCEVEAGKRGEAARVKQVNVAGLLLTRTHAVLVDARRWPVHVNTHVPFATVYTGDPEDGAQPVDDSIRHDWDLGSICYKNRSGSLTLMTYVAKSLAELDQYREHNRVYTLNVFLDPKSFHTDCEDFRQKTFLGFWSGRSENIVAALERLVAQSQPVLTQADLDDLAHEISSIGPSGEAMA